MPGITIQRYTGSVWENLQTDSDWNTMVNKPSTYTPTAHNHDASNINAGTLHADRIPTLAQSKVTNLATDLINKSDKVYVHSRGQNLLTNGTALLGNNTNFGLFTFDGQNANNSPGSFRYKRPDNGGELATTDEYMPVEATKRYKITVDSKSLNGVGRYYMMTMCYDVDNLLISARHHMYRANTLTTLAQELKNGDTVVYLTSATNWDNSGTAGINTHLRSIILWNYTNSYGYTYPPLTYSRKWTGNAWDPGAINFTNNTITLRVPWAGGTIPAGTPLSNGSDGGTYKYNIMSDVTLTTDWVTYTGIMEGMDFSGTNVYTKFSPGTAKIRLGWLMDYQGTGEGETAWFTNMTVSLDYQREAEKLKTARKINGVNFDGSADISISAPASDVSSWAKASTKPTYTYTEVGAAASVHNHSGVYEPANANIQTHVTSAHAPSNAQKNSDITKAEIEAKLTGLVTTHEHAFIREGASQNQLRFESGIAKFYSEGIGASYDLYHKGNLAAGTGATNFCAGNDARLSDARTPSSHVHGNISNDGKIGSTAGLIIKTGASGVLTTLAAGTTSQYLRGDGTWDTPAGSGGLTKTLLGSSNTATANSQSLTGMISNVPGGSILLVEGVSSDGAYTLHSGIFVFPTNTSGYGGHFITEKTASNDIELSYDFYGTNSNDVYISGTSEANCWKVNIYKLS